MHDLGEFSVSIRRSGRTTEQVESSVAKSSRAMSSSWLYLLLQFFGCETKSACIQTVKSRFPFVGVMRGYKWKSWLAGDVVSGLCVGMVHVPQGLGFALLAGLPPVYGLYSSIYPPLVYFLLGTCHHLSLGTMALISLIIKDVVTRQVPNIDLFHNESVEVMHNCSSTGGSPEDPMDVAIQVALSLTCIAGAIQMILAFFRLGIIADFMSPQFLSGFITGATFHIITSQLPYVLGTARVVSPQFGYFRFFRSSYSIIETMNQVNFVDLIISMTCIVLLVFFKEFINVKYSHALKMPIPIDMIVVVGAIMLSYFVQLGPRYDVHIVNTIEKGLPVPSIPSFYNFQNYIVDGFVIAMLSFVINMSMVNFMSQKHGYSTNSNQEMLASGVALTSSSFLGGFAGCGAPPRALLHDSTGGKTQLSGVVSATLIVLVCLVLAPLFEPLPVCVLASIILVALLSLLKAFLDLPALWKKSKADCSIWIISCFSVIIVDIDFGLVFGISASILSVLIRARLANTQVLYAAKDSPDLFLHHSYYIKKDYMADICVLEFSSPLMFVNARNFADQVSNFCHSLECIHEPAFKVFTPKEKSNGTQGELTYVVNVSKSLDSKHGEDQSLTNCDSRDQSCTDGKDHNSTDDPPHDGKKVEHHNVKLILNLATIPWVDTAGFRALQKLRRDLSQSYIGLYFANCSVDILHSLKSHDVDVTWGIFPTLNDAVAAAASNPKIEL